MSFLRALADGDLAAFTGLPPELDLATVGEQLGPPAEEEIGRFSGQAAAFRTFAATPAAPFGIKAWTAGETVYLLEIREPVPATWPGDPDATAPSGLGPSYEQRVYERGLVLHVSEITGEIRRLYAFAPMAAGDVLKGPIGLVEERRIPRA